MYAIRGLFSVGQPSGEPTLLEIRRYSVVILCYSLLRCDLAGNEKWQLNGFTVCSRQIMSFLALNYAALLSFRLVNFSKDPSDSTCLTIIGTQMRPRHSAVVIAL